MLEALEGLALSQIGAAGFVASSYLAKKEDGPRAVSRAGCVLQPCSCFLGSTSQMPVVKAVLVDPIESHVGGGIHPL